MWESGRSNLGQAVTHQRNLRHRSQGVKLMRTQFLSLVTVLRLVNSRNICCHSDQNVLSDRPLSKNLNIKIYSTIISPIVLYGCDTWSLVPREENRLRVLKNRVLRRIFEPERGELAGDWRRLHNEKLHNLYASPNIIQ